MQVDIRARNLVLSEALRTHVERRLQFALSHFQDRLLRITVCLSDMDSSGMALQCHLDIRAEGWPDTVIEDTEADIHVAINRAVARAGRTLERQHLHSHLNNPLQRD
ncbi:MAG: HPF/RaiA family ribosome-associated protein [Paraperlucidibaca sp.]